jgi:hypothetical protein
MVKHETSSNRQVTTTVTNKGHNLGHLKARSEPAKRWSLQLNCFGDFTSAKWPAYVQLNHRPQAAPLAANACSFIPGIHIAKWAIIGPVGSSTCQGTARFRGHCVCARSSYSSATVRSPATDSQAQTIVTVTGSLAFVSWLPFCCTQVPLTRLTFPSSTSMAIDQEKRGGDAEKMIVSMEYFFDSVG